MAQPRAAVAPSVSALAPVNRTVVLPTPPVPVLRDLCNPALADRLPILSKDPARAEQSPSTETIEPRVAAGCSDCHAKVSALLGLVVFPRRLLSPRRWN